VHSFSDETGPRKLQRTASFIAVRNFCAYLAGRAGFARGDLPNSPQKPFFPAGTLLALSLRTRRLHCIFCVVAAKQKTTNRQEN
jgi:hypothetical protein